MKPIWILTALLLCGCRTIPDGAAVLDATQVKAVLKANGLAAVYVADDRYRTADAAFVRDFPDKLFRLQAQLGQTPFAGERNRNDCEDYARLAHAFAQTLNRSPGVALAFGSASFEAMTTYGRKRHAVNFALIVRQGKIEPLFFEPQNCTWGDLGVPVKFFRGEM